MTLDVLRALSFADHDVETVTTADEIREGVALLDEALETADRYYTGS